MEKKKQAKTGRKSKTPLEAAAEREVQTAGKDSVTQAAEEIKAENSVVVEEVTEALPQAEPVKKAQKKQPKAKPAKAVKEKKPKAKSAKAAKETQAEAKPVKAVQVEQPVAEPVETVQEVQPEAESVEVIQEVQPEAEPVEAVQEVQPEAEPVEVIQEVQPVAEPVEVIQEVQPEAEPVETVQEVQPEAEPVEAAQEVQPVAEPVEAVQEEQPEPVEEPAPEQADMSPRRSVAFIGSECYPFVKTGGLGDVMYALPKALVKQNCDVKVILPRYKCIPWEYQEKMIYRGSFHMDLCADGRSYYVGIMEYIWDGVVYDFIDNEEFFGWGNPYTNLIDDIPKYCYFAKAALAALNYMDWVPDVIHCHDWQAALIPVYLRTLFVNTKLTTAKTILTIHNLRFQGIYDIPTIRYWSGLPDYVFNKDALKTGYNDANMLKGGLAYANVITTVSQTYAGEIQSAYYGETLDAHLRYHSGKLCGIVNGIDYDIWNPATDACLHENYDISSVLEKKKENKRKLQEELGLVQDENKFVIGLISRLTNQKGLDLVNAILSQVVDEYTQVVVLGSGDKVYEDSFRYYENAYKGSVCANIMYDEARSHRIYAGADALLVPSQFEPCGLTQLIAMHYGTIPIVRETGGLKDTVEPYNMAVNTGNGFTFDRYEAGLLLDAINRAKAFYFDERPYWDEMVRRDMEKDLSWENSAKQYKDLYLRLTY